MTLEITLPGSQNLAIGLCSQPAESLHHSASLSSHVVITRLVFMWMVLGLRLTCSTVQLPSAYLQQSETFDDISYCRSSRFIHLAKV